MYIRDDSANLNCIMFKNSFPSSKNTNKICYIYKVSSFDNNYFPEPLFIAGDYFYLTSSKNLKRLLYIVMILI
jgi:hypothetical protein